MEKSKRVQESVQALRGRIGEFKPRAALILGSGLGDLADLVEDRAAVPYGEIPHFRASTAPGHRGALVFGALAGVPVAVMQGRMHFYEGYSMEELAFPVYVLRALGCEELLVTNACGGVNESFVPGDIMLLRDHLKLIAESPLRGENDGALGVRFPDMSYAYDPELRALAREAAQELDIPLREGVYLYMAGPQYETPAEIRMARLLGADAVGMSTVPEVIAARHCGLRVLGFSLVSNLAAGMQRKTLSEQEVLDTARRCRDRFSALVLRCLEKL